MTEVVPFKYLVEALAELFGMDEMEVLDVLLKHGIGSWRQFVSFTTSFRVVDKSWG